MTSKPKAEAYGKDGELSPEEQRREQVLHLLTMLTMACPYAMLFVWFCFGWKSMAIPGVVMLLAIAGIAVINPQR